MNRRLEAFKESLNLAGLATAAATSAALSFSPVPLAVAVVAQVAYLAFVPNSRWYEQRLSRREDAAILARRSALKSQVLPTLTPANRARFAHLEDVRARLSGLGEATGQEGRWYREILRKLDFLLEKFLQFAAKEAGFRIYVEGVLREGGATPPASSPVSTPSGISLSSGALQSGLGSKRKPHTVSVPAPPGISQVTVGGTFLASTLPPVPPQHTVAAPIPGGGGTVTGEKWAREATRLMSEAYDREAETLRLQALGEPDEDTRIVIERRAQTLTQRREVGVKLGRILANLNHQMHLFEDTFGLISDELMARPPEQLLSDIDDVVAQANAMTRVLDEVAPIEHLIRHLKV